MPTARSNAKVRLAGLKFDGTLLRTGDGWQAHQVALPTGTAGSLTTRTNDDIGEATLESGHGLQDDDTVDVYWSGGARYRMNAQVAGDVIALNGTESPLAGDDLPAEGTAVVVTKRVRINSAFDGDDIAAIVVGCDQRVNLDFTAGNHLWNTSLAAGEIVRWFADQGLANPLTGDPVQRAYASNGSSTTAATLKIGLVLDTTP